MSESTQQHREAARERGGIPCAVLTISDTRTLESDRGGALIIQHLEEAGHRVVTREILPDDLGRIQSTMRRIARDGNAHAVIVTGGTGIAERDITPEAIEPLLTKRLAGFGEIFRMLSWEEIGAAAMLSRAVGGVMGRTAVLVIPGSTAAVRLAMERLIVPELAHLVHEAQK
ncbi:MogA/MoaB family molybdenum cofactor biosynthesis protein [Candidatus Sumerlaeota bacterium]|nr:MogA/MoaB family molybdenum cofactor biosynthesis protein [Candidatus Sumerlaeota bacterium]